MEGEKMDESNVKENLQNSLEELRNENNKQAIDEMLKMIQNRGTEEIKEKAHKENLIDENGNVYKYMLERYINQSINKTSKRLSYQAVYGRDANPFENINKIVLLEKAVEDNPIELHIVSPLPDSLTKKVKTKDSKTGEKIEKNK